MGTTGSWGDGSDLDPEVLAQVLGLSMGNPKAARARVMQSSLRQRAVTTPIASRPSVAPVNDMLTHDGLPARRNADGTSSTELSVTVTDPRLNGGRPTNIPSLWGGRELDSDSAVSAALQSGRSFSAFNSIPEAVAAAKARSAAGGAGAPSPLPQGPDFAGERARIEAKLLELSQPKDLSALQAEGKRRGAEGQSGLLMALAAQQAGPEFQGVQQHMLQRAMAARDPLKFSGGIVNPQGDVIEDPGYKEQEQRAMYERRLAGVDRGENAAAMAAAERARRAEAAAAQEALRRDLAGQTDQRMREMQQASFGFRQGQADQKAAGADKPTKPMPSGMQKAYLENRNNLNAVDRAISAHAAYPGAFGLSNLMGDAVKQRTDPKGVAARAAVADLGSLKIHDRSGAAVTAMEFPRLRPFIPSATDEPEVVRQKLINFKATYEDIQREIMEYGTEMNYNMPSTPSAPPAAPAAPAGAAPKTMSWGELK